MKITQNSYTVCPKDFDNKMINSWYHFKEYLRLVLAQENLKCSEFLNERNWAFHQIEKQSYIPKNVCDVTDNNCKAEKKIF